MLERKKIGSILVDLQVLTPAEVERVVYALRKRRDQAKFGQVARDMGLLQEEHILAALAVQMQLFPGIQNLSLNRLLTQLQDPPRPALPRQRTKVVRSAVSRLDTLPESL
jgi:hypothetical protein